jgi:predicted transcriptional regulator
VANPSSTLKQQAQQLIDHLPDAATWDDLIERARFLKAIEEGVDATDRGEFADDEDVRRAFARWGIKA